MQYIKLFFTLSFLLVFLLSCSIKKEEKVSILQDQDLESQMIQLYNEAYNQFLEGDTIYAAKKFGPCKRW